MNEERRRVIAIAAMDEHRVIGCKGTLPWNLPEDLKRFRALTTGHAVLLGRKTYESLPEKARPLPNRLNVVLTARPSALMAPEQVLRFSSPEAALAEFRKGTPPFVSPLIWIIGGEQIYRATQSAWDEVYLTLVKGVHEGDAFFPEFEKEFEVIESNEGAEATYLRYIRR